MGKKANGKPTVDANYTIEQYKMLQSVLDQHPAVVELPVSSLRVDDTYQDRPREKMIVQIVQNFTPALLGIALVSERPDGSLYIVDGETRRQALLQRGGPDTMRCQVFKTSGCTEEALFFSLVNSNQSRRAIKLLQKLQAYHIAGIDKGFGRAIKECGFSLTRGKTQLRGPVFVKMAWDLDEDGTIMKKTLMGARAVWGDHAYDAHGYVFLGIAKLYHSQLPKVIDAQVRRALKTTTPKDIADEVAKLYVKHGGGKMHMHPAEQAEMVAGFIGGIINKSRGAGGKVDLKKL
jgi:hypothetical protein